ncbi:AMP-binding protein [Streptomyces sp. NPDC001941]|uniref:AMP-binding protein n=1 Tax=Streptomyces sp. NPDC001941 TaxID=3154659 RepID=UPI0033292ABC
MLHGCTPWPEEFVDRYWLAGHWRGVTLDGVLRDAAREHGPRTALVQGGTRLTYAALNRRVDRVAAGFRLRGLGPGQRVVVQLPDVPEYVTTVFALLRVGAVPVPCPVDARAPELSRLVEAAEAVGYVGPSAYGGHDHAAAVADVAARRPFLRRVFTYEPPNAPSSYGGLRADAAGCHYFPLSSVDAPVEPPPSHASSEVAFLLPSSAGSEGDAGAGPLLVPRTHNDYAYQARAAAGAVALGPDDVYLAASPLGPGAALGGPGIVGTFAVGGTVVLVDGDAGACLRAVEEERVTVASMAPATGRAWLEALAGGGAAVGSLRLVQVEGAPFDGSVGERIAAGFGCRVQSVWAPVTGPVVLTEPGDAPSAGRGRPLSPDDEVRVADAEGGAVEDGARGELLVRGPYTPRGHYRAPEHDARAFTADGFLRTGMSARRAADGALTLLGRHAEDLG